MDEDEQFYCGLLIETFSYMIETIQEQQVLMSLTRVMTHGGVIFTFYKTFPNGINVQAESKLRRQPHLEKDLQNVLTMFYQILLLRAD
ncbi:MAG: hypothetical protein MJE68_29875 [Proteobacteria bacterium]|nr:hypothetical protein [Pseudomonadota bacterium]